MMDWLLIALLLVCVSSSFAQGKKPCDFELPGSSLAAWYPDSRSLIFERSGNDPGIYRVNLEGLDLIQLISGSESTVGHPAVFPDGKTICFQKKIMSTGNYALFILDSTGDQKLITDIHEQSTDVSIHPSGTKIAYVKQDESGNLDIYTKDLDDNRELRLTNHNSYDYSPHWSPNGDRLLFTSHREGQPNIYIMEDDGSNVKLLTPGPDEEFSSAWSPGGERVVYSTRSAEKTLLQHNTSEFHVLNLKTEIKKRLTLNQDLEVLPNWSPDGRYIAYTGCKTGNREVYILDLEIMQDKQLTVTR